MDRSPVRSKLELGQVYHDNHLTMIEYRVYIFFMITSLEYIILMA